MPVVYIPVLMHIWIAHWCNLHGRRLWTPGSSSDLRYRLAVAVRFRAERPQVVMASASRHPSDLTYPSRWFATRQPRAKNAARLSGWRFHLDFPTTNDIITLCQTGSSSILH